ncbi:MAG TPA: hypothetical protein VMU29_13805 [Smithella sp.]|nr:hypothetical protein [Smithella sp.]
MTPEIKDTLLCLWILLGCIYGILWLRRFFLDKEDSFGKYILPDLLSHGFNLESSIFIEGKTPESLERYKTALHPASGGSRIASFEGYKVFRTITVKDKYGKVHELLAAIEFDDRSLFRRFKGVSWTPELSTLIEEEK